MLRGCIDGLGNFPLANRRVRFCCHDCECRRGRQMVFNVVAEFEMAAQRKELEGRDRKPAAVHSVCRPEKDVVFSFP